MIEQLEDNIDDLGENLDSIVETALLSTADNLPLLDRSKLYVLVSYAIESIIFCLLRYPRDCGNID